MEKCNFEEDFKRGNMAEDKMIKYAIAMRIFKDSFANLSEINENENIGSKDADFEMINNGGEKFKIEFKVQEAKKLEWCEDIIIEIMHDIRKGKKLIGWVSNHSNCDYLIIIKKFEDNYSYYCYDYKKLSDSFKVGCINLIDSNNGVCGFINWLGKDNTLIKNKPTYKNGELRNISCFIIIKYNELKDFLIDSEINIQTSNLLNWIGGKK